MANADLVEVVVRPRCRLWRGGAVFLPGARLTMTDDEYAAFARRRIVSLASPENVSAIADAIERGFPVPGYALADDLDGVDDPADPADVGRRASKAKRIPAARPTARRATRRSG